MTTLSANVETGHLRITKGIIATAVGAALDRIEPARANNKGNEKEDKILRSVRNHYSVIMSVIPKRNEQKACQRKKIYVYTYGSKSQFPLSPEGHWAWTATRKSVARMEARARSIIMVGDKQVQDRRRKVEPRGRFPSREL